MDSIEVPKRYFCPNPLDLLTEADFDHPYAGFKYYLDRKAVVIDGDKARWVKRSKNRILQIYWVRFVKSETGAEDVKPDQICGKIIFDVFKIFDKKPEGSRYAINELGFARLTGPTCPVDGWSHILIFPRMYRADRLGDFFHPDNPAGYKKKYLKEGRGAFGCIPRSERVGVRGNYMLDPDINERPSDVAIIEEVETSVGKMMYCYAILEDAIDSFVTVKLLEWKGEGDSANVYGKICATNTRIKKAKSTIFQRERCEAIRVRPGQYIPIDRPVNIVSVGHWLKLSFRIMHTNMSFKEEGADDLVIAETTKSFESECVTYGRGEDGIIETQYISGKWGRLEVKVYFLPCWSKSTYKVERDSDDEL